MNNLPYDIEMISNFSPEIMIDNEMNNARRDLIYNTEMITYNYLYNISGDVKFELPILNNEINIENEYYTITDIIIENSSDNIIKSIFLIGGSEMWIDYLQPKSIVNIIKLHTPVIPNLKFHNIRIEFSSSCMEINKVSATCIATTKLNLRSFNLPLRYSKYYDKNVIKYASGMACLGFV